MALIVQIALGILLGFLLIEYRHKLGRWALLGLKVVFGAAVGVALGTALSYAPAAVGITPDGAPEWLVRLGRVLKTALLAAPILVISLFGAYGLFALARKAFWRWFKLQPDIGVLLGFLFLSWLIVWPLDVYLRFYSPLGEVYRASDQWSRRNGYDDLLGALLSFSLTLWPWVILLVGGRLGMDFYPQRKSQAAGRQIDGEIDDQATG